jgi:ribokinase
MPMHGTIRERQSEAPVMTLIPELTVLGSINVDLIARTSRLPGPGETVTGRDLVRRPGGKGANQAAAASRLGAYTRLIGAVGSDQDGDAMLEALHAAGVDCAGVSRSPAPTGTALVVVDDDAENQIVVVPGANELVDTVFLAEPSSALLAQLELPIDVVTAAARQATGFFALNAAPAQSLPAELLALCDLVIVNEHEYSLIPELSGVDLVAVTYGSDGAALLSHGVEIARAPAVRVVPVNTVGAGDAFCAGLVLSLSAGLENQVALATACAVGAAAVLDERSQPHLAHLTDYMPAGVNLPKNGQIS